MSLNPRNTCARFGVQLVGGLFVGENSLLRLSDDARLKLDEIVPSESGFALETMARLLQYWNVDGTRFDHMPENYTKARRITHIERSELELTALSRRSLLHSDYSLMLYDVGVVYGGLMFRGSGLEAWEDTSVLLVDTLYPDFWRSRPTYDDEWNAYEDAARQVTSVPDRVVELIKMSTLYNSCTNAIERRSSVAGYPSGIHDVANALVYKSFESIGYGLAAIYDYARELHCETDELIFAGWLIILCHDISDYARDCYEENYVNSCMILHGLGEDGFSLGCAVLFAVWNSLDCFSDGVSSLYRHTISTSLSGNLSIPRYCAKEQLTECTTPGEWSIGVKTTAINVVKRMTGVDISWPENVAMTAINDATVVDYHRMAINALYKSSDEHVANLCIEWANEIINSTLIRDRTVRYVKRVSTERGIWA
ncbi:hypothetical protein BGZ46_003933 [Entomortierella lignicola]|nr:hypothetical protein BGZ46_003933 [Entomortierella lignicola]